MTTQIKAARAGKITEEIRIVARDEDQPPQSIRQRLAEGTVIITRNTQRENVHPIGIGKGLSTKINANIGTSPDLCDLELEIEKAKIAVKFGADTIMDLSTGGDLDKIRRTITKTVNVPIGTVPIYQTAIEVAKKKGSIMHMTEDDIFSTIEKQAKDGVDFMTVHCGVTQQIVKRLAKHPRLMGIVSRGGTFLAAWILHHKKENPLYANYDYLLEIAAEYDLALSLGDGLRPGCIFDSTDWPQVQELLTIGELVERAKAADVQAMVEGPGHLPLNNIEANVQLEKSICKGAPFYVLGPVVTEIAPGYDHIVGAIGGAIAGLAGADFLCYLTPSEHLGLPNLEDVKEGVIVTKIAAHAVDIVKLGFKASARDLAMAKARADLDWKKQIENALDPEKARKIRSRVKLKSPETCSMCSEYCAIKILREALKAEAQCL
ncbi:MAG: phosphomethylpyrimidine synthase ThiC [Candidatus Bathyarchaeota archaeon]|nr:phosphomethylpyrimidine synthase ThiC [Candidatus Bathyarchaeota archaeon]MDH5746196.1 phosphomethylpyrimidine synthase ThiC [Candidatus Bathyarchaeota archaeon]